VGIHPVKTLFENHTFCQLINRWDRYIHHHYVWLQLIMRMQLLVNLRSRR